VGRFLVENTFEKFGGPSLPFSLSFIIIFDMEKKEEKKIGGNL